MRTFIQGVIIPVLFGSLAGCTIEPAAPAVAPLNEAQVPQTSDAVAGHGNDAGACPVTEPRRVENVRDGMTFDPSYIVGNDTFWTFVAADAITRVPPALVQPDGSMRVKWPWLYKDEVAGEITIVGQVLSEPSTSATSYKLAQNITSTESPDLEPGTGASTSSLIFPAEGCWEITATKGAEQFRFVTHVVKRST